MNKLIIAALALGLAGLAGAQAPTPEANARWEAHRQRHVEHLTQALQLTPAQALEVQAIFAEQATARRALHERIRAEREALRTQTDGKLAQVLTAEQQAELAKLRAERQARWHHRRHGRHGHGTPGEG